MLESADIRPADGFAAVSSGDNSNILAARVVREQYGVDNVVARIYDQGRAAVYERLGIPTVATVRWTVGQVMRRLLPEGTEPVWRDPSGTVRLLQVYVNAGWVGKRIRELSAAARAPIPFLSRMVICSWLQARPSLVTASRLCSRHRRHVTDPLRGKPCV